MTHEIKKIFDVAGIWQKAGKKLVLATVVSLEGSSYRRPGVRMLLNEDGEATGIISGGCVEKEVLHQARSVFQSGTSKVMSYDGRLRVGCEGVIYVLLEPIVISDEFRVAFKNVLQQRLEFRSETWFYPVVGENPGMGSCFILNGNRFPLQPASQSDDHEGLEYFTQTYLPLFRLIIFGAEHDAVQLCKSASHLGWEITIIASPEEDKSIDYFPGAAQLISLSPDRIDTSLIDSTTAVMIMSHSFQKDVRYLIALHQCNPAYIGLLGPAQRREQLISKLIEYAPGTDPDFLDQLHGPAGLDIGAENASEVAVSVIAEILSEVRHKEPIPLRKKAGSIHG